MPLQRRASMLRRQPSTQPSVSRRQSVVSSTSTGAPLSFRGLKRTATIFPVAGAAISQAATYLYTGQHLLKEGRPGRATDYLKSSLGLYAVLVASSRVNDAITAGIAEAHLYLAKAAHEMRVTPEPPEDPKSHLRRAQLALAEVGDGVDISRLLKEAAHFNTILKLEGSQISSCESLKRVNTNSPLSKVTSSNTIVSSVDASTNISEETDEEEEVERINEIKSPLEELADIDCSAMLPDRLPDRCYDYFTRCAFPADGYKHPALMFGRQRASTAAAAAAANGSSPNAYIFRNGHVPRDSTLMREKLYSDATLTRKKSFGFVRRRWSSVMSTIGNSSFHARRSTSSSVPTTRTSTDGKKYAVLSGADTRRSVGDIVELKERPAVSHRRMSLSQIFRRKALSPKIERADTVTSVVTEASAEDRSLAQAKLRRNPSLRRNPARRGLAAPVPTRSAVFRNHAKNNERKETRNLGFFGKISQAVKV